MSTNPKREIYTNSASQQLPLLLQAAFTAELIAPGKRLWLVSPWISNIPLLDNSAFAFRHVEPRWPKTKIRFTAVLEKLLSEDTSLYVVSNDESHNDEFFRWLEGAHGQYPGRVHFLRKDTLHLKGILGDHFYLKGSMNFTFNGLTKLDERIELVLDPPEIANAYIEFAKYWNA